MRISICCLLALLVAESSLFVRSAGAELPELPLTDTRLTVSNLVREDVFAGWRSHDMKRFSRAEKNLERLMEQRPNRKAEILVWQGGTTLYRAIVAWEAEQPEEFERFYGETLDLFQQAKAIGPNETVVSAVIGGSYVVFGDRLPKQHQAAAWSECYDGYQKLWANQSRFVDKLPPHIRGELLAGLILSTERTGKTEELNQFLDKAIEVLPGSRYATVAQQWKDDPELASTVGITCKGCHAPGRLSRRIKQFAKQ